MPLANLICAKCKTPQPEGSFLRKKGGASSWCSWCRDAYRARMTRTQVPQALKASKADLVEQTMKAEGYAEHPLGQLLALAHLAGAKKALALRDGQSWKGRKAWREYYEAKRELDGILAKKSDEKSENTTT